jgi:hypothetical protein
LKSLKRPASRRLFADVAALLPAAASPQQTVDGLQAALEIGGRSSYVPVTAIGVRSPVSGDARPNATRLELPPWMKL